MANIGQDVIVVEDLRKSYGPVLAVDGLSFTVGRGEIFGLVGPNGAGKTTTVECLEGLRRPDGGRVRLLGRDPRSDGRSLRERIGIQLQESELQDRIKVWEAMDLYASFYQKSVDWRPLIVQLGLEDKAETPFAKLSGGQKQRLFVALALVNDPDLVIVDELTTGLDPQARHAIWDLIRTVRDRGKTVVLTTHFMEEAEKLCDRVAIMDRGRLVALDTPENLIRSLNAENRVVFIPDPGFEPRLLESCFGVTRGEASTGRVIVYGHGERLVADVVDFIIAKGFRFRDLRTEQASLEDVFLALTGREIRE
ncbi:MAG: ABC transporter ATP-binding protein [Candidatus Aminicenantes bacterium]|nr:ABC transporter ATP-binding protein [Candidatus Aminicenantes bacterium]